MINVLDFAKIVIQDSLDTNGIYIDFTAGNGYDTLFLSKLLDKGWVFAFDVLDVAITSTTNLLAKNNVKNVTLIKDCHSNFDNYINGEISGGIFNLGYLPNHDKTLTTLRKTTEIALNKSINCLKPLGVIVIVLYTGHNNGKEEAIAVENICKNLNKSKFNVTKFKPINMTNPPYVIVINKTK